MPQVPQIRSPTQSRKQAEGAVLVSSLVVLAIYSYRKLIEPHTLNPRTSEPALRQIVGLEPKPAPVQTFAIAYSFVFFSLSVGAIAASELATGFAILIAVGYTLSNGGSVFVDVARSVGGPTGGEPLSKLRSRHPAPLPTLKPLPTPPVSFGEVAQTREALEAKQAKH